MKRGLILALFVLLSLASAVVWASGDSAHLLNGFQGIYYYSIRVDERFPSLQPIQAAIREFQQASREGGDVEGEARLMLGLLNQVAGKFSEAGEEFAQLIHANPNLGWAYVLLADVQLDIGDVDSAYRNYGRALEFSDYALAHYGRALIDAQSLRIDEAIEQLKLAVEVSPTFAEASLELGKLYYEKEQYDLALTTLEEANRHNSRIPEVHYYLGLVFEQDGEMDKAIHAWERALQLDEKFEPARRQLIDHS